MKRRQFLSGVAAATTLPALPVTASSGVSAAIYTKAAHYARLWGTSVPEMYTSALGLNLSQATTVFNDLVADKIIATPNASGIAKAVAPYFKAPVLTKAAASTIERSSSAAKDAIVDLGKAVLDTDQEVEPVSDQNDEQVED